MYCKGGEGSSKGKRRIQPETHEMKVDGDVFGCFWGSPRTRCRPKGGAPRQYGVGKTAEGFLHQSISKIAPLKKFSQPEKYTILINRPKDPYITDFRKEIQGY